MPHAQMLKCLQIPEKRVAGLSSVDAFTENYPGTLGVSSLIDVVPASTL
jgi:hypothetical protein